MNLGSLPRSLMILGVALGLVVGVGSCSAQPEHPPRPAEEARLGGELSAFGIRATKESGIEKMNEQITIRWKTYAGVAVITGIAETWYEAQREQFMDSGSNLTNVSEAYLSQWGPTDARVVNVSVAGGTQFTYYDSPSLRELLENEEGADKGLFTLAIVLDTSRAEHDAPLSWPEDFLLEEAEVGTFTVALFLGHPWVDDDA